MHSILLDSVDKVKRFVNIVTKFEKDAFIKSGRYIIDAKSIMGIFSLDLTKPLLLETDNFTEADAEAFSEAIQEFIVA